MHRGSAVDVHKMRGFGDNIGEWCAIGASTCALLPLTLCLPLFSQGLPAVLASREGTKCAGN